MTRLTWAPLGERYYETGVDRGVLYPALGPGVPWHGLTAVKEAGSGGSPKAYYVDGYKYLNVSSAEEYEATLEAFAAPFEFAECDGTLDISNGLFVTNQPRASFGLAYRTKVGNDIDGPDHGYKIHLVYNALAAPSSRDFSSMSSSAAPSIFSWRISTLAPRITGRKPTAHFVIDSRMTPPTLLRDVEDVIYGSDLTESRLPSVDELIDMFNSYAEIELIAVHNDGEYQTTQILRVHKNDIPPVLGAGEEMLWLNTSSGNYATLHVVTGE